MGCTGIGKSTLAHAIFNQKNLKKADGKIKSINPLMYNRIEMFNIGDGNLSVTGTPGYYPLDIENGIYLVDGAGMCDAINKNELHNQSTI